ncbi:hypothetical protein NCAS_0J02220 [Naumovozyma castellii]|uniref:Mitochondrial import inner membrane translocase subunit n=1 Tax=Naumovozyma castellii TaxID=27288 RepID=G0VL12_NAUCA|nr:hypothetical protein NCAS_0J02220 [Naumovozyma castellii CBS 4309]CCC72201.1 hypothetical protein NCAS_0J02220 [Naumovozyma castellii CBS 4309]
MSLNNTTLASENLAALDDSSKKEIAAFLESENSKQKVQMSIHQLTNTCFKNCVSSITDSNLNAQEEECLSSCVNKFLDTNIRLVKGLQNSQ